MRVPPGAEAPAVNPQLTLALQPSEQSVILLVEDDDHIAGLISLILKRSNLRVLRARDCAAGSKLFTENRSDIAMAIVDGRLPDGDGTALCRTFREAMPHLPVLLTSGRDQKRSPALAGRGATAFLAKPFLPSDVQRTVAGLLGPVVENG